jgi:hypothetical protein
MQRIHSRKLSWPALADVAAPAFRIRVDGTRDDQHARGERHGTFDRSTGACNGYRADVIGN